MVMKARIKQIESKIRLHLKNKDEDKMLVELNEFIKVHRMLGYEYRAIRRIIEKDFGIDVPHEKKPFVKKYDK